MPSLKPKVVRPVGSCSDVLLPDHLDTGAVAQCRAGARQGRLQPRVVGGERRNDDVDVRRPEGRLPVGGGAVADVAQGFGARPPCPAGTRAESCPATAWGTPRARSPCQVRATATQASWLGSALGRPLSTAGSSHPRNSRPACRSSTRRKTYLPTYGDGRWCSAPLWMSSISTLMLSPAVTAFTYLPSLEMLGRFGRIGIGRCQVGERRRGRPRRLVDPVPDDRPVPGIDELSEDRVDHVVVERPSTTGFVWFALRGR